MLWGSAVASEQNGRSAQPVYEKYAIENIDKQRVHSATVAKLADNSLIAFWFSGSREGAADVAIYSSRFSGNAWSKVSMTVDRQMVQRDLGRHIRKLGNPAALSDGNRTWLFFVSVSVGGWSASSVNVMWSDDNAASWSKIRRLYTSPFFNISTLVRTAPLLLDDGSLLLPAYHELAAKYPLMIHVDRDGGVRNMQAIAGARAIQPSVCTDGRSLYAVVRNSGYQKERKVLLSVKNAQWSALRSLNLENPDSSVVCLYNQRQWLVVGNRSSKDRSRLSLAVADDPAGQWRWIHDFENTPGERFSYPAVIRDNAGIIHVLYSWNRRHIKHILFNTSWIEQMSVNR